MPLTTRPHLCLAQSVFIAVTLWLSSCFGVLSALPWWCYHADCDHGDPWSPTDQQIIRAPVYSGQQRRKESPVIPSNRSFVCDITTGTDSDWLEAGDDDVPHQPFNSCINYITDNIILEYIYNNIYIETTVIVIAWRHSILTLTWHKLSSLKCPITLEIIKQGA